MNSHDTHILELPNEILFLILKKLDNIDVLYSFWGINHQRLDILVQEQIFSTILNFVSTSETNDEICTISDSMLDRLCVSVLPQVHQNVKGLTVEGSSIECILRTGDYPNLTELKLVNFNKEFVSRYFIGKTSMRHDL